MYDTIVQIATTFSHGPLYGHFVQAVSIMAKQSPAALKLKALRKKAGLTVRAVADAIGMPHSTYASKEDKFKGRYLPIEFVSKLVPVFEEHGIGVEETLALAGVPVSDDSRGGTRPSELREAPAASIRPNELSDMELALMIAERIPLGQVVLDVKSRAAMVADIVKIVRRFRR